jgi:acetyltransferase-like isoleucine patch superfamily enzyme
MGPWHEMLRFLLHPLRAVPYMLSRFVYPLILRLHPRVVLRGKVHIRGFPMISVAPGGCLVLGADVKLNSRNEGYHLNMHSPVKLVVGASGARLEIGDRTRVHGTCIHAREQVSVGHDCLIAANTQIIDSSGHDLSFPDVDRRGQTTGRSKPIVIGDSVWIGANCIVLPGAAIGDGSVIAAGSVVTTSIPRFVLARGNPASVVRSYEVPATEREELDPGSA